ncbi:MAG: response regulator [bacterium]
MQGKFSCIQAYSFKQGLRAVSTSKPDLIILDVMMEDISAGFRFMRQFRNQEKQEKKASIPILMVSNFLNITGIIMNDQMKTYLRLVDKFIEKPVEPEVLLENINKLIH